MHRKASLLVLRTCLALGFIALVPAGAHEPGGPPHRKTDPAKDPAIVIEPEQGVNPWNHLEFRNDPGAFQFAIVTDRTGGARPGVFEEGVRKLNLLQPEFVMSVGDLIEGYTKDRAVIAKQWDEFQGFIGKLEMPFFYVPGNHDYSNEVMAEVWKTRFGRSYYSFVYRDVLFLCLNSQEPEMHRIGEEQADWVRQTLATHKDVRWTLVFLHTPMWEENYAADNQRGWAPIEEALQGRPYTVFAGHFHTYMKRTRHDRRYYTLATTGGGSSLRGPSYGEFDEVAWVTMTEAGPLVTNLLLQGIWGDDVHTPELKALVNQVSGGILIRPETVWVDGDRLEPTKVEVNFTNPLDVPVETTFSLAPIRGTTVEPLQALPLSPDGKYVKILQPGSVSTVDFTIASREIPKHQASAGVAISWEAKFQKETLPPVTLRERTAISIVPRLNLEKASGPLAVDGKLEDWPPALFQEITQPAELLHKSDAWKGPDDCRFRLAVCYDDQYVYGAVDVRDEQVQAKADVKPWAQDGVEFRIDARPAAARNMVRYPSDDGVILIAASPSDSPDISWLHDPQKLPEGTKTVCIHTDGGYILEVAIPVAALGKTAGGPWEKEGFRVNVSVNDRDGMEQTQLWWQPDWRGRNHIPDSGTFRPRQ